MSAGAGSTGASQPSMGTRLQDWFLHLPLATRCITALCTTIYVIGLLFGHDDASICIYPPYVIKQFQVYRLLTAGFFHVGFLHLVMNMLAFQALAPPLERSLGSFVFTYLVVLFQLLSSLLNTLISLILSETDVYTGAWVQCTLGLSSVLFSFLVLRSHSQQSANMSLFGFASVPAQWYPWVLLVLFQFLMPEVSFLGHLTGILVAYLYVLGYLDALKLSSGTVNKIESSSYLEWLVMKDGYITNTQFGVGESGETLPTHQSASSSSATSTTGGGLLGTMRGLMGGSPAAAPGQSPPAPSSPSLTFVPFSGQGYSLRS